MNENMELVMHIYKDAEMGAYATNNLLTLLLKKENKIKNILEYEIKGEGWWNVNRFEKVEQRVTFDEFYLLEQRVERLETILAGLRLYELKKDLEIF